jgi:methyl-accepting chemotaxis protein
MTFGWLRGWGRAPKRARIAELVIVEPVPAAAPPANLDGLRDFAAASRRAQAGGEAAASAADAVGMNVRMVGGMMGQLQHGIHEVSSSSAASTAAAHVALESVRGTVEQMRELRDLAKRIGEIVEMIETVSRTTDLLSLNATIEAAHAGDAGRGFAVVASEVKALAGQTREATGEVRRLIDGIGAAVATASERMGKTEQSVASIDELVAGVSRAIVEQEELTTTVKGCLEEATQSVASISGELGACNACVAAAAEWARTVIDDEKPGETEPASERNIACLSWNGTTG